MCSEAGICWSNPSRFRIASDGITNIETGRVDYRVVAHLVKVPAKESEPEKLHSAPVVVNLAGTLVDHATIDWIWQPW